MPNFNELNRQREVGHWWSITLHEIMNNITYSCSNANLSVKGEPGATANPMKIVCMSIAVIIT